MSTGITPEKIETFQQVLGDTGQVGKAAAAISVSRVTAYRWRKEHPDFAAAWDEGLRIATIALEDEARRRAQEGTDKPVYQNGQLVGTVREYSDTLAIFLLKACNPAKYRDRVAVTGEDGGALKVETDVDTLSLARDIAFILAQAQAGGKDNAA